MRAEFHRPENPDEVVAVARLTGTTVEIEAGQDLEEVLRRVFRPVPVSVDEPSHRSAGTAGPVLLHPGTPAWFVAAARSRGDAAGLVPRFVTERDGPMGWDPAGAYRTFRSVVAGLGRPIGGDGPAWPGRSPGGFPRPAVPRETAP